MPKLSWLPRWLAGAFLLLAVSQPAQALYYVNDDPGGIVDEFIQKYEVLRASHDRIVVDGMCASACTLMLGIVPAKQVCVTNKAVFGFHSAVLVNTLTHQTRFAAEVTQQIFRMYPKRVRHMLEVRGWDGTTEHPDLIKISGTKLYKTCPRGWDKAANAVVSVNFTLFPGYDPNAPIFMPDEEATPTPPVVVHPSITQHKPAKKVVIAPKKPKAPAVITKIIPHTVTPAPTPAPVVKTTEPSVKTTEPSVKTTEPSVHMPVPSFSWVGGFFYWIGFIVVVGAALGLILNAARNIRNAYKARKETTTA